MCVHVYVCVCTCASLLSTSASWYMRDTLNHHHHHHLIIVYSIIIIIIIIIMIIIRDLVHVAVGEAQEATHRRLDAAKGDETLVNRLL